MLRVNILSYTHTHVHKRTQTHTQTHIPTYIHVYIIFENLVLTQKHTSNPK